MTQKPKRHAVQTIALGMASDEERIAQMCDNMLEKGYVLITSSIYPFNSKVSHLLLIFAEY